MLSHVVAALLQQTPSPSPTAVEHSDGGGWSWVFLLVLPVVLPIVVAGFLSSVLWIRNEGGWETTPWTAVGIPAVVIGVELVPLVYLRGLSSVLSSPPQFQLALATVTGVAVVGGAAVKRGFMLYILTSALVGVGALAVIIDVSDSHLSLFFAIGYTLVGFVMGHITGKQDEPATEPTEIAAGPP